MKSATGCIIYKEKRKRWIARFARVDKETGKQKEFKRYCLTKTDARKKLQGLKTKDSFCEESRQGQLDGARAKRKSLIRALYQAP